MKNNITLSLKDRFRLAAGRLVDSGLNKTTANGTRTTVTHYLCYLFAMGKIKLSTYTITHDGVTVNLVRYCDVARQTWEQLVGNDDINSDDAMWCVLTPEEYECYNGNFYSKINAAMKKIQRKAPEFFDGTYNYGAGIAVKE